MILAIIYWLLDEENRPIEFSDLIRNLTIQMFVHYAFGIDINESKYITDDQQRFMNAIGIHLKTLIS